MAYLNRALTGFRAWINTEYPNRDKTSDGWIGDADHALRDSQHNPDTDGSVDAIDVDVDGVDMERLKRCFEAHVAAKRWIHNRQIANKSEGWKPRPYSGDDPHTGHGHFESDPAYETSDAPWTLEDDMTEDQANKLSAVHWATTAIPDGDGGRIALHVWAGRAAERIAALEAKLDAALAGGVTAKSIVDELIGRLSA